MVVSGLEPGGWVVLFGVSQGHNGFIGYYLRHDELLVDEDGDGTVRWEPELLPARSVLAAVDLASGEVGVGSPEGFEPPPVSPSPSLAAGVTELVEPGRWLYALWVRPGPAGQAGVWGANFGDGGATDADGAEDGTIRAPLSAFGPRGTASSPPPEGLAAGDTVLAIDPQTLVLASSRVAG